MYLYYKRTKRATQEASMKESWQVSPQKKLREDHFGHLQNHGDDKNCKAHRVFEVYKSSLMIWSTFHSKSYKVLSFCC